MPAVLVPRPLRLSVAVLTALLFAAALLAWSAGSANATVVTTMDSQSPAEIRAYWTPQRMQAAEPVDLPQTSVSTTPGSPAPAARGHSVEIPPSSGASTFDFQPGNETTFPQSVHGKVFFTIPRSDGGPDVPATCSGTLVASRLKNVVFTAGHCVKYPATEALPSTNLMFVPGYRNGSEPFGEYPATTLLAPKEWTTDTDLSYDVAIAQLASPLELTLGAGGIAFNKAPRTAYKIFGYPALPTPTYNGEFLIECDAPFYGLEDGASHPFSTVIFPCGMKQGSSGGGWINPAGDLVSVVSHGYDDPALDGQMAGPYFGQAVKQLYNQAGGSAECPPAKQAAKQAAKRVKKAKKKVATHRSSRKAAKRLKKASKKLNKAKNQRDAVC